MDFIVMVVSIVVGNRRPLRVESRVKTWWGFQMRKRSEHRSTVDSAKESSD